MQEKTQGSIEFYQFRCASISEPDAHHIIEFSHQGHILCSCRGESWCSHIDAVLLHGERAMVPSADHSIADAAQRALNGKIGPYPGWRANWKNQKRWRGIPLRQSKAAEIAKSAGLPLLSIEGRGTSRRLIEQKASELEWIVSPYPVRGCVFHLTPTDTDTASATKAKALSIPILSFQDWLELADELTGSVLTRIAQHRQGAVEL